MNIQFLLILIHVAVWASAAPFLAPLYEHASDEAHYLDDRYIIVIREQFTEPKVLVFQHDSESKIDKSMDESLAGMGNITVHDSFEFRQSPEHDVGASGNLVKRDLLAQFQAIFGYTVTMDEKTLHRVRQRSDVLFIERDQRVFAFDIQENATWGLSRVSHRDPIQNVKSDPLLFEYPSNAGEGVDVYVLDTGVRISHKDFGGRATWGATMPEDDRDVDANGHGTHVAGTIAGSKFGVAKKAKIIAVKVLSSDGSGSLSDVIKGIEWVINDHREAKRSKKDKRSVANMSLGGGKSRALENAVNYAVFAGVHFAVAAGNDNKDACNVSPANAANAVTVGAIDVTDKKAIFSNHGSCVDIFAPGKDIESAWNTQDEDTKIISGTSMASPHVAGVMAVLLSSGNMTPQALKQVLITEATLHKITGLDVISPNRLLFMQANMSLSK